MNYEEEIRCRNDILSRIRNGEKVAAKDRMWLTTHCIYNYFLGYPYLNTDIIQIHPKTNYYIRIKAESIAYPDRILPVITVPGGKGKIVANFSVADLKGNVTSGKPVKMLGVQVNSNHNETKFTYWSDLGLLGVSFECDYFDDKQHLLIRKDSGTGDPNFAMLRETLADNKILYRCKAPNNDSFDDFVFSVEWEPANK